LSTRLAKNVYTDFTSVYTDFTLVSTDFTLVSTDYFSDFATCTGTDNLGGILNFFVSQIYLTSFGVLVNHDLDKSNPRDREATIPF
jgi:hypothetical protein